MNISRISHEGGQARASHVGFEDRVGRVSDVNRQEDGHDGQDLRQRKVEAASNDANVSGGVHAGMLDVKLVF